MVKKYEFPNEAKADEYIRALGVAKDEDGNDYPTHNNGIVKLGFITLEHGEYDDEGNETKAPVLADKYSVDVFWRDSVRPIDPETEEEGSLPLDAWTDYEIVLDNEGVHSFYGVKYIQE
jgi:hypothetical protein